MKETEDIIRSFKKAQLANKKTVLATVVHVEGSSYRRPGARMLVTEDGELTGAISGGCLEGDALRKALLAISQQQNKLVTYDTTDDEDNAIGIQLGCNGIVHILFEPIDPAKKNNPIALLEKTNNRDDYTVIVTLFSLEDPYGEQPGTCLAAERDALHCNHIATKEMVKQDIQQVFGTQQSIIKQYIPADNRLLTGFIELVQPPVELIIAGAGNDVFPMVQMANILGWHVTVTDGRKTHATANRFSEVKKIIVGKPIEVIPKIPIAGNTVFVLMSHNYNYDIAMLEQLLQTNCNYIGLLGPKKKLNKMLDELKEQGLEITEEQIKKIYGPVGLDIGAETAEEIALSIISEIKAVLAGKQGTILRNKDGFIHDHNNIVNALQPVTDHSLSPSNHYQ